MRTYSYDHMHLLSPNPVKTAEFYEEILGAKRVNVTNREGGTTNVSLDLNGLRLLVMNRTAEVGEIPSKPPSYGIEHFGIVTDDLEAAVTEMKAKGVKFGPPQFGYACDSTHDEVREFRPGIRGIFLWAPENVLIELLEKND